MNFSQAEEEEKQPALLKSFQPLDEFVLHMWFPYKLLIVKQFGDNVADHKEPFQAESSSFWPMILRYSE